MVYRNVSTPWPCDILAKMIQVVSWDEDRGTVDTNHEDGRSYISALSEVIYDELQTCNGTAKVIGAPASNVG